MLEELLKEIIELKEYKKKYEYALANEQRMSDELFMLMMAEYERTSYEQRVIEFKKKGCRDCRYRYNEACSIVLPEDIGMPIKSDMTWIPATKSCESFRWD